MKVYLANLQLINQNIQNRPNQFLFLFSNLIIGTIDTSNESLVIFNDSRHFVLFAFFLYPFNSNYLVSLGSYVRSHVVFLLIALISFFFHLASWEGFSNVIESSPLNK